MPVIKINDCGTDVAEIGLWDKKWSEANYRPKKGEAEWVHDMAVAGNAFLINTSADGSYSIHIHINQYISMTALENYKTYNKEYGFRCESGKIVVGGVEDFGSARRIITSERDEYDLEPGIYTVRLHHRVYDEDEHERMLDTLPERDRAIYDRYNSLIPLGCILVLAVPFLALTRIWELVTVAGVLAVAYYWVINLVFGRLGISKIEETVRQLQTEEPDFYIELRTATELKRGGVVYVA